MNTAIKFLLDENIYTQLPLLKHYLGEKEYDVVAQEAIAPGASDLDILAFAMKQGRMIITFDVDFSGYRFRDNYSIPYGVIFIQESKHRIRPDDALMTRKLVNAIESIAVQASHDLNNVWDTIFTLSQPTPYGITIVRPKRYKDQKEVTTICMYIEEHNSVASYVTAHSIPIV